MDWADRVRALRERLGLTQEQFRNLINASGSTVEKWEMGIWDPTPCYQILLVRIEERPEEMFELLSEAVASTAEPWPDRLKRIRKEHDLSQGDLATILSVTTNELTRWEGGLREPAGCAELMLHLFENRYEAAGLHLWPALLKPRKEWTGDRVRTLRESFRLSRADFADLLGVGQSQIWMWENEKAPPGPCTSILLWLLEMYGPYMFQLMSSLSINEDTTPERFRNARAALDLTQDELARLFGVSYMLVPKLERQGSARGCWHIVFSLLEAHPKETVALLRALPQSP